MSAAKQPWSIGNVCLDDTIVTAVMDCDGDEICNMGNSLMDEGANAERIVACVNDYAALEARCAGLERERDAWKSDLKACLKMKDDLTAERDAAVAAKERAEAQLSELDSLLLGALAAMGVSTPAEGYRAIGWSFLRDHLRQAVALAEAAEEALRDVIRSATHVDAVNSAGRYLAGHAPATSPRDAREFEQHLQSVYEGEDDEQGT